MSADAKLLAREPTPEMVNAVHAVTSDKYFLTLVPRMWRAMWDAAQPSAPAPEPAREEADERIDAIANLLWHWGQGRADAESTLGRIVDVLAATPEPVPDGSEQQCHRPLTEFIDGMMPTYNAHEIASRVATANVATLAAAPEPGRDEYMCPNCVTPWKCNGPHIPEPCPQCEGYLGRHKRGCPRKPMAPARHDQRSASAPVPAAEHDCQWTADAESPLTGPYKYCPVCGQSQPAAAPSAESDPTYGPYGTGEIIAPSAEPVGAPSEGERACGGVHFSVQRGDGTTVDFGLRGSAETVPSLAPEPAAVPSAKPSQALHSSFTREPEWKPGDVMWIGPAAAPAPAPAADDWQRVADIVEAASLRGDYQFLMGQILRIAEDQINEASTTGSDAAPSAGAGGDAKAEQALIIAFDPKFGSDYRLAQAFTAIDIFRTALARLREECERLTQDMVRHSGHASGLIDKANAERDRLREERVKLDAELDDAHARGARLAKWIDELQAEVARADYATRRAVERAEDAAREGNADKGSGE